MVHTIGTQHILEGTKKHLYCFTSGLLQSEKIIFPSNPGPTVQLALSLRTLFSPQSQSTQE